MSTSSSEKPRHHVLEIVDKLDSLSDARSVAVSDVVRAFGAAAFLPMLMVPGLLVVSPLSGIPLFSTICGLTIALISSQLLIGRKVLWLPAVLTRREVSGERLRNGVGRVRGIAKWIDRHTRDRLQFLVTGRARWGVYLLCLLAGLAMPFMEVVPFSSSILGVAVLCFAAALLAIDGLFVAFGLCFLVLAILLPTVVVGGLFAI